MTTEIPEPNTEPKPSAPEATPDILEAARQVKDSGELLTRMLGPETPPETGTAPTEPSPAPETPPAPAEPAKPAKAAKTKVKALTSEQIASIAAKAAAEVLKPAPAQDIEPTKAQLPPDDDDDDSPQLARLKKVEELFPEKYPKGTAKKQAAFEKQAAEYEKKWRKKNPDMEFDPEDGEHDEFYAGQPDIDEDDLKRAEAAVLAEEAKTNALREVTPKLTALEQQITRLKAEPLAERTADMAANGLLREVLAGAAAADTPEGIKAWADQHPLEVDALKAAVPHVQRLARTVSLLWDEAETFDDKNTLHGEVIETVREFERNLSSEPESNLTDAQGVRWVPLVEFNRLAPNSRAGLRTTDKEMLIEFVARREAGKVKAQAAKVEALAARYGYVRPTQPENHVSTATQKPSEPAPVPAQRPLASPASSAGAPISPQKGTMVVAPEKPDTLLQRLWG